MSDTLVTQTIDVGKIVERVNREGSAERLARVKEAAARDTRTVTASDIRFLVDLLDETTLELRAAAADQSTAEQRADDAYEQLYGAVEAHNELRERTRPARDAEQRIAEVEAAAKALGAARALEQTLEDERALKKSAATQRIIGTLNPETGKPHSASSAKDVVESDELYFQYRQQQASAVVATEEARGRFYASLLRAELALTTLKET